MTEQALTLESFLDTTGKDIERKINEMITDPKMQSILKGGKRLRPLLSVLVFKVCAKNATSDQYQKALEVGISVELAHNASLVHDDIIDQDPMRRGEPSFYIQEGIENAILVGHKMLASGAELCLKHSTNIAQVFIDAWRGTLEGQLKEVNFSIEDINGKQDISADSKFFQAYSEIIDLKTASLFSSACKAAALEAGASEALATSLEKYGREVGFAYQLADDIVDLVKGEMIDSVVIPLLVRLEKKSIRNGSLKAKALKKKLEENSPEIKQLYLDEIKKHLKQAQELSQSPHVPTNIYTAFLQEVPNYIINKMLKEISITI